MNKEKAKIEKAKIEKAKIEKAKMEKPKKEKPKKEKPKKEKIEKDKNAKLKKKQQLKRMMQFALLFCILILTATGIWGAILLASEYNSRNTFSYQYNEAVQYYKKGSYDKALSHLNKALKMEDASESKKEEMMEMKYLVLLAKKDYDDAITVMLQMIEDKPSEDRYYNLMELYGYTGKYDQMELLAEKLAGTEYDNVYKEYMVGNISVSLEGGNYANGIKVEMKASKADLIIHYTLDGSIPTKRSNVYTEPFVFEEEGAYTIRAIGINSNGMECEEVCETYVISFQRPDKPLVSPATGTYSDGVTINITGVVEGVNVYYTLDGTVPTKYSEVYTEPIDLVAGNYVFCAVAIDSNGIKSEMTWKIYEYMPKTAFSYNATLIKLKGILMKEGVMLDMEGNTIEGTVVKENLLGIYPVVSGSNRKYYVFQITSEYKGFSETLDGYYAISVDDGEYIKLEYVDIN